MLFSEKLLKDYAKPLTLTEEDQCKNAISMVIDALKTIGFDTTKTITRMYNEVPSYEATMKNFTEGYKVKLFLQGSYANNTNVRQHSDVEIAVLQDDIFRTKYRNDISDSNYGFTNASKKDKAFKDIVEDALDRKFGSVIERKNKSIKINGNTYRKDADSVPCIRYRDYSNDYIIDSYN